MNYLTAQPEAALTVANQTIADHNRRGPYRALARSALNSRAAGSRGRAARPRSVARSRGCVGCRNSS